MISAGQRSSEREQFWRELIAAWKQSGQSVREFCQARGVTTASFYVWRRRLAAHDRLRPKPLVPVRVVADAMIEVVLPSGVIARIPVGMPASTIAEYVSALASSC